MSRPFKVGDRVWDAMMGFGTIKNIDEQEEYPIVVFYDGEAFNFEIFTIDGRCGFKDSEGQALFHADEVKDRKVQK